MRLPVSTQGMTLIVGGVEPVVDRSTGAVRVDRESGRPLFTVHVMAVSAGDAKPEQWPVRVCGEPAGFGVGSTVAVKNLVAVTWEMEDRHGLSFRADSVQAVSAAPVGKAS
ncbi:MAG: hypothetical protein H0T54_06370 [Geodermatophilaceae bacterium]|nr:hypothetical protein [Geodermatophilaceae bacterium]